MKHRLPSCLVVLCNVCPRSGPKRIAQWPWGSRWRDRLHPWVVSPATAATMVLCLAVSFALPHSQAAAAGLNKPMAHTLGEIKSEPQVWCNSLPQERVSFSAIHQWQVFRGGNLQPFAQYTRQPLLSPGSAFARAKHSSGGAAFHFLAPRL